MYIDSHQNPKRKHVCTIQARRPGRYINRESCISTAIRNESERTSDRHSSVDGGDVSTAISKAKVFLAQPYITSVVQLVVRGHEIKSERTSGRHRRVVQSVIYQPRELYINSDQNGKRMPSWSTELCRPGRRINRNQQRQSIFGAVVCYQRGVAVYQRPSKVKRKHFQMAQPFRPGRYQPRSAKQKNSWRSCILTVISKAKAYMSCI